MQNTGRGRVLFLGIAIVCALVYLKRDPEPTSPPPTSEPVVAPPALSAPAALTQAPITEPLAPPVRVPALPSSTPLPIPSITRTGTETSPDRPTPGVLPNRRMIDPRTLREVTRMREVHAEQEDKFLRETLDLREDEIASIREVQSQVTKDAMAAMQAGVPSALDRMGQNFAESRQRVEQVMGAQKYARYREFKNQQDAEAQKLLGVSIPSRP